MSRFIIDIETNGLLEDMLDYSSFPYKLKPDAKLWCVVLNNTVTGEIHSAINEQITKEWLKEKLKDCKYLIGHNIIEFDLLALKLFGVLDYSVGYLEQSDKLFNKDIKIVDTLVVSRLLNPDRYGGHSLEAWGERLGAEKIDFRKSLIEAGELDSSSKKGSEFNQYSDLMLDYCITPENKVLNENLDWIEASTLNVGDKILGFDEYSQPDKNGRRYRTAIVESIKYEKAKVYDVELSSGKIIKTTAEHRWLVRNASELAWVQTKYLNTKTKDRFPSKIPKLFNVWEEDQSKEAGWLSGIYDGEGCLSKQRFGISIAQRPTKTLDKLEQYIAKFYKGEVSKRHTKANSDCISLLLNGQASQRLEFLGVIKPQRLIDKFNFEMLGRVESRSALEEVIDVRYAGEETIIKMQTSTRTFVAEGYPMHNCKGDTVTNAALFQELIKEIGDYKGWTQAIKLENKLADLAVRRENLGFWFDKDLAIKCLEDLTAKMKELSDKVNPILPEKKMNKGELSAYTLPKVQILKGNKLSSNLIRKVEKLGAQIEQVEDDYFINYEGERHQLPYYQPLRTHTVATIDDLDHVKMHLINLGWNVSEWKVRDLTKNAKKEKLPYEKRIEALKRWYDETMAGKYKEARLKNLDMKEYEIIDILSEKLREDYPVNVPTSPSVRVGVEKELCPNLVKLGDKVAFANDFALYLTYKHRKACIAGGDIEDMDFAVDTPNTGYLSMYREVDSRVRTPAILIGAATSRYRHIGIANVPRASSIYGKEMRSLFGCGKDAFQFGMDYSSLENRIQGSYVTPYEGGEELAEALVAEKPRDIHSLNAKKLNISRTDAKSVTYALLYGAQPMKISKMLAVSLKEGKRLFNEFWNAVLPLKLLKEDLVKQWETNDCKFIIGIDGRKINIRSKHSILNFLFQSGGVISVKYGGVFLMQLLEEQGYCIDPFIDTPDVCEMISYHDELQMYVNKKLIKFKMFDTEEEAKQFADSWQGDQLSAVSEGKKWYVTLPNDVSKSINKAIKKTEEVLKLNVHLGFEFKVASNWEQCH